MGQDVTPGTTIAAKVVMDAIQAGLDPVAVQNALLADITLLQILLPDHTNGNGSFATVQLTPGTTVSNQSAALLAFAGTAIFDALRRQGANLPSTITFADALRDYFNNATFTSQPLVPLTAEVNTAVEQGQPVIGLGRNDVVQAASTGTILGTVTETSGTPLAGVQVSATPKKGGPTLTLTTATDTNGRFILVAVPPDSYTVTAGTVFQPAQASVTVTVIAVVATNTIPLMLTLPPAPPALVQLLVADGDLGTNEIYRYDGRTGAFLGTFVPQRVDTSGIVSSPWRMVFGPDGNLYVVYNGGSGPVVRYNGQTGAFLNMFIPNLSQVRCSQGCTAATSDPSPRPVFGPDGNFYSVGYIGGVGGILRFNGQTGAFLNTFVPVVTGGFFPDRLGGLAFGPDGNLYVSYPEHKAIYRYDGRTGAFLSTFVPQGPVANVLVEPGELEFGPDGNLYVTDRGILRFNGQTGAFLEAFPAPGGPLFHPVFGPDGTLYVSAALNLARLDRQTGSFKFVGLPRPGGLVFGISDLVFFTPRQ
jgi:streptogramin lyase